MKMLDRVEKTLDRRFGFVALGLAFIAATLILIFGAWIWNWKFGLPASADKTAPVNTIVAVSAYTAALVGVLIALIAYWQASGRAFLEAKITFGQSPLNQHVFEVVKLNEGLWTPRQYSHADVVIENCRTYAARNPGLRITFDGLRFNTLGNGWTVADFGGERAGYKAIQWDGGTENIVHGKWSRTLPGGLDFSPGDLYSGILFTRLDPPPRLIVTVVADGCPPRDWPMPIKIRDTSSA